MTTKPAPGKKDPYEVTDGQLERWLDLLEDIHFPLGEAIPELVMFLPKCNPSSAAKMFRFFTRLFTSSREALTDAIALGLPRSLHLLLLRDDEPALQKEVLEFFDFLVARQERGALRSMVISNVGPYLLRLVKRGPLSDPACQTIRALCAVEDSIADYFIVLGIVPVIILAVRSGQINSEDEGWVELIGALITDGGYQIEEFEMCVPLLLAGLTATKGQIFSRRCATLRKLCIEKAPLLAMLEQLNDDRTIILDIVQRISNAATLDTALAQEAAVGFLGDLASLENPLGTTLMIKAGVLSLFKVALDSKASPIYLRKEACYTLSNVAAGTDEHRQAILSEPGLVDSIMARCGDSVPSVRTEALYAARNLIVEEDEITQLVEAGIIKTLIEGMVWAKEKLQKELILSVEVVLDAGEHLSEKEETGAASESSSGADNAPRENSYIRLFREGNGVQALKSVISSQSAAKAEAEALLKRFFSGKL